MHRRLFRLSLLLALVAAAPGARGGEMPLAELRVLDKVTARVTPLLVPVGETVKFGTLEITLDVCARTPPEEPPEDAAFLEVRERRANEASAGIFSGWMFSSSPGLSAMEHPVYDIWVVACRDAAAG